MPRLGSSLIPVPSFVAGTIFRVDLFSWVDRSIHQFKEAVMTFYELQDADLVSVDDTLTKCTVSDWQRRVSIYNVATETDSAADVASGQVRRGNRKN